jgi:hypothetical protein
VIVVSQPARRELLHVFQRVEQVLAQPVVAHRLVVAFDVSILLGLAGLNVLQLDAAVLGPECEHALLRLSQRARKK